MSIVFWKEAVRRDVVWVGARFVGDDASLATGRRWVYSFIVMLLLEDTAFML